MAVNRRSSTLSRALFVDTDRSGEMMSWDRVRPIPVAAAASQLMAGIVDGPPKGEPTFVLATLALEGRMGGANWAKA